MTPQEIHRGKIILLVVVLGAGALLTNQVQRNLGLSPTSGANVPIPTLAPPAQQMAPLQNVWAANANPTRTKTVPRELSFAPEKDGSYKWVEILRPGDDLQIILEVTSTWTYQWYFDKDESLVEIALRKDDGSFVYAGKNNPPSSAVRFRLKPGVQKSVDFTLRLHPPPGFAEANARKNSWAVEWKPTRSLVVPNNDISVGTWAEEYVKTGDVVEVVLGTPEYQICIEESDARNFTIKYGDDVSCWDFFAQSKNDELPSNIYGSLRARFRIGYFTLGAVRLRFTVKNKAKPGLFVTTGQMVNTAKFNDPGNKEPVDVLASKSGPRQMESGAFAGPTVQIVEPSSTEVIQRPFGVPSVGAVSQNAGSTRESALREPPFQSLENHSRPAKLFRDLSVSLDALRSIKSGKLVLTLALTNLSPARSTWVALNTDMGSNLKATIIDPEGSQYAGEWNTVSGIAYTAFQHNGFFQATEIGPSSTITPTITFSSREHGTPTQGTFHLQMELLSGPTYRNGFGEARLSNLTIDVVLK